MPALKHALASRWYGAPARFEGLRITATDTPWSTGDADAQVAGPIADLMLVATGRVAGLPALEGSGVAELTRRLTS